MKKEKEKQLLSLIMNCLTERFDKIEIQDPDQSYEKRKSYMSIRNNIRNVIKKIAKLKQIDLLNNLNI